MAADCFNEACRRRVNDDAVNGNAACQAFQLGIMFLVGALAAVFSAVVVTFPKARCHAPGHTPKPHAARVIGAVVNRHKVAPAAAVLRGKAIHHIARIVCAEKGIHQPAHRRPSPQHKAVIIYRACIFLLEIFHKFGRQKGVVVNRGGLAVYIRCAFQKGF